MRKPANDLEREFQETVEAHKDEMLAAYNKVIELSDKYGIPFGTHVPEKFKKHFYWDEAAEDYGVDLGFAERLLGGLIDGEFWQSSTNHCEMW